MRRNSWIQLFQYFSCPPPRQVLFARRKHIVIAFQVFDVFLLVIAFKVKATDISAAGDLIIAYFNMNNRFIDSLKIPIEHETEVQKIKSSVTLDPSKVRQYLQTILDNWPEEFPEPNPD